MIALLALCLLQDPASRPDGDLASRKLALEWNDKGIAAKKAGKSQDAVEAFKKALEYDPNDPTIARNLGAAWNDEGVRLLEKDGNADKSIAAFDEALKKMPSDPTVTKNKAGALDRRGHARLEKRQFDAALSDFKLAISLDPAQGRYPTSAALVAYTKEDLADAEFQLEDVVRRWEKEVDAWVLLGETRYKSGDLRRALEAFERALQLAPERPGLKERVEKVRKEASVEGDFVPQHSYHFEFHFPPKRADMAQNADLVASLLEDAYLQVGRSLDCYPDGRTQVIFYEVKDFGSVTKADEWVGALYDGKIRVPIRDFSKQQDNLKKTLFHEYTHRVIHALARNRVPTWFNEGIAQMFEEGSVADAEKRLKQKPEKLLEAAQLRGAFVGNPDPERARIAYDQSLSITNYLVEQRGWSSIGRYLKALGDPEIKVDESKAFEDEFRMGFDELLKRWRLSLGLAEK
jgi:tetratricopeptide (TPR) repeat protein